MPGKRKVAFAMCKIHIPFILDLAIKLHHSSNGKAKILRLHPHTRIEMVAVHLTVSQSNDGNTATPVGDEHKM